MNTTNTNTNTNTTNMNTTHMNTKDQRLVLGHDHREVL